MSGLELCLIDDPADPEHLLLARRLDDWSAIVVTVTPPGRRQRFGDRVALGRAEPEPADRTCSAGAGSAGARTARSQPATEPRASLWRSVSTSGGITRYQAGRTLEPGGYQTDRLEGPHPGEAALVRLDRQVTARGWALGVRELPSVGRMIELLLATPAWTSAVELDAVLGALTGEWAHRPAYPELAARAGGNEALHLVRRATYAVRCAGRPARTEADDELIG